MRTAIAVVELTVAEDKVSEIIADFSSHNPDARSRYYIRREMMAVNDPFYGNPRGESIGPDRIPWRAPSKFVGYYRSTHESPC